MYIYELSFFNVFEHLELLAGITILWSEEAKVEKSGP